MKTSNSHYFSICKSSVKPLAMLVFCFLIACTRQNDTKQILSFENQIQISASAVNINTASAVELEKLPRVGKQTAQEIIEHREKFGRFRKPEYLMFVRGISDRHFREMRNLVKVE